jgi:hypothetical protein
VVGQMKPLVALIVLVAAPCGIANPNLDVSTITRRELVLFGGVRTFEPAAGGTVRLLPGEQDRARVDAALTL